MKPNFLVSWSNLRYVPQFGCLFQPIDEFLSLRPCVPCLSQQILPVWQPCHKWCIWLEGLDRDILFLCLVRSHQHLRVRIFLQMLDKLIHSWSMLLLTFCLHCELWWSLTHNPLTERCCGGTRSGCLHSLPGSTRGMLSRGLFPNKHRRVTARGSGTAHGRAALWAGPIHFSCLLELLHSVMFKVKPTLISLIGAASAAFNSRAATMVVPCLRDVLTSEEWATSKDAASNVVSPRARVIQK
jgi:hypothetical protein